MTQTARLHHDSDAALGELVRHHIRTVPDWPVPGVQFRDITPLLQKPDVFRSIIDAFVRRYSQEPLRPDVVAGLDARGFILGAVVAYELGVGFVPVRKKGKLPYQTIEQDYALEYGHATVAIHSDAIKPGSRVLLIDDLLATGGTAAAAVALVRKLGGEILEVGFLIELKFLNGREKLPGLPIRSLVVY